MLEEHNAHPFTVHAAKWVGDELENVHAMAHGLLHGDIARMFAELDPYNTERTAARFRDMLDAAEQLADELREWFAEFRACVFDADTVGPADTVCPGCSECAGG